MPYESRKQSTPENVSVFLSNWLRRALRPDKQVRRQPAARLGLEPLEGRLTPTFHLSYSGGDLAVSATAGADSVAISQPVAGQIKITLGGTSKFDPGSTTNNTD